MKGVIVYKGRYGATEQYANWLGNTLQFPVYEDDELPGLKLNEFDYVIAGTSVYVGKMLLAKWIRSNEKILMSKKSFLFVVCATPSSNVKAWNSLVETNISPALMKSLKIFSLGGRMIKDRLSFIDRAILHLGASFQKDKSEKERMLKDFDDVREENLTVMLDVIKADSLVSVE